MSEIRSQACSACPYRQDVPSGVWSQKDYDKLPPYDAPTSAQPLAPFACHATPGHLCHGWAVVHTSRGHEHDLMALRVSSGGEVPPASTPLFGSGTEASEHGKRDIDTPSDEARRVATKLVAKYERLQINAEQDVTA
jgi:hypothetical protein